MSDYAAVYRDHAAAYDELVAAEDVDNNLGAWLAQRVNGSTQAIDIGAGTGRVTRALLELGATVRASDREAAMIDVARQRLSDYPAERLTLGVADAGSLPYSDGSADFVIAGWVYGHFRSWMPDDWRDAVGAALSEMRRVAAAGATLVIIETQGTGVTEPRVSESLDEYFAWLESEHGFERTTIRTDYLFDSVEQAATRCGFFFGEAMAERIRSNGWARVPEFTGVWSRTR